MAIYIKMEGITGGSTKKGFEGQIETSSVSFGANRASTARSGKGGAGGEAFVHDINFTKAADDSSVELFLRCAKGTETPTTEITLTKSDGQGGEVKFLTYKLENVYITSWSTGASGGQGSDVTPQESVAINFKKIDLGYTPQGNDQAGAAEITGSWSIEQGQA